MKEVKKIFELKTFWLVFLLASSVIFIAVTNLNHLYQTETDVLIIPKDRLAIENSNQIIENLSHIPLTVSFFKELNQKRGYDFDEAILELPDYKKQAYWENKVKVVRIKKSGILKIITLGDNNYQAEILNKDTIKTFLIEASSYYNIKTSVDIRIINEPVTSIISQTSTSLLFLESFIIAFILVLLIFWSTFSFFKKEFFLVPQLSKRSFDNSQLDQHQSSIENDLWLKKFPANTGLVKEGSKTTNKGKKAQAPANLPMYPNSSKEKVSQEKTTDKKVALTTQPSEEKSSEANFTREATSEEVKSRLNKLLKGY